MSKRVVIPVVLPPKNKKKAELSEKQKARAQKSKDNPSPAQEAARFPPGVSGNPSGRPKGTGKKLIGEAYVATLEQQIPVSTAILLGYPSDDENRPTWAELIAFNLVSVAAIGREQTEKMNGGASPNLEAIQEMREVTEGAVVRKNEFTGKDGAPLAPPPLPVFQMAFVDPVKPAETKD